MSQSFRKTGAFKSTRHLTTKYFMPEGQATKLDSEKRVKDNE